MISGWLFAHSAWLCGLSLSVVGYLITIGTQVLGLPSALFVEGGPVDLLRKKLADEPSVRGNEADDSDDDDDTDGD